MLALHETELSMAEVGLGSRVATIDQPDPFQRSASGSIAELVKYWPTAMHEFIAVHDTPLRPLESAPEGLGVLSTDQFVPFQRSASGPSFELPTAMHAVLDWHQTPFSELKTEPDGIGAGRTVQFDPSHCSISARLPETSMKEPTAMQFELDVHQTLLKELYGWVIEIDSDCVAPRVGLLESITPTVKLATPTGPLGVPVIAPVEAFRVSPAGSEPEATDHPYGGDPPVATSDWL